MCGITALVGGDDALNELLTGLENLEYRGYDSVGVAVQNGAGLSVSKRAGQVSELNEQLREKVTTGHVGIGHTRWSTHGAPTDENAHPHLDCDERVAVVHNGIIENHDELREELRERGHEFTSETDTEVIPHLVEEFIDDCEPATAFRRAIDRLEGSYAVATMVDGTDAVYATRQDSPLVLGVADDTHYLASDVPAFLEFTDEVVYLEDGDVAVVGPDEYEIAGADGRPADRPVRTVDWTPDEVELGGYDHFMAKEIEEQPTALAQTVRGRATPGPGRVTLESFPPGAFADVTDVRFVGCGTSYHAALYARQLLVSRGVRAEAYRAPEYVTAAPPVTDGTLVVAVTQSGETADTLAAVRQARAAGARTLAVTNVVGSTATRECDDALFIRAGPEIGVAATKTFSSQVATLALLDERIAADAVDRPIDEALLAALSELPDRLRSVLDDSAAGGIARQHADSDAYFFIGRGAAHPVALEGALKFKEITYEHAEGFSSGELKHGPLALVTPDTTVVSVCTGDDWDRTISNMEEVRARGADVVAIAEAGSRATRVADETLRVPETHPEVAGVLANVQLQLLAYRSARLLERPIDKPRNLAKSVTVE
jgi:glucosamine--fructose-6-phosphate aminotransferase (isomerizing)